MAQAHKIPVPALEPFLMGALDLIDVGWLPSRAVSCGAAREDLPGLALILGIDSLTVLDDMPYEDIRRLLSPYTV